MHLLLVIGFGIGALVAVGLLFIALRFFLQPRAAARGYGVPDAKLADRDPFWTVKGGRDLTLALLLGWLVLSGSAPILGGALLIGAVAAVVDAVVVLRSGGSPIVAFGVHAATAALCVVGGLLLVLAR